MRLHWGKILAVPVIAASLGMTGVVLIHGPRTAPAGFAPPAGYEQKLAAAEKARRPVPVLIIGDSYVAGGGEVSRPDTFPDVVCDKMRWTCNYDAQGGTGYVADGQVNDKHFAPYIKRLGSTGARFRADYVIVTGGRNDNGSPAAPKAVRDYLRKLRGTFPKSRIIVLSPLWNSEPAPATIETIRTATRSAAKEFDADWVNTAGWLNESLMGPDDVHPTKNGHAAIASHLLDWIADQGIKPVQP